MLDKIGLVRKIAEKTGYTIRDSEEFLNCFMDVLRDCIINREEISVRGFGHLKFHTVSEHKGAIPITGKKGYKEEIIIPAFEKCKFTLSSDLRRLMRKNDEEEY